MSEHWTVVFDGTDHRPLGRLLFPPTLPAPVRPRYLFPIELKTPAAPSVAQKRTTWRARRCGEVHAHKDRIW